MPKKISTDDNFNFLLYALLFLLFSIAAVEQFANNAGQHLVLAATVVTLFISVWSIRKQAAWFRTGVGVIIFFLLVATISTFFDQSGLDVVYLFLLLVFFVMTAIIAGKQVILSGEITGNKIIGSICIFLLLGLIWAILYLLLLEFDPATLNNVTKAGWYDNFSQVVYFSFVTLTTLGYGEITPALPVARFLAFIEAIMGLFYIAVMVASLVGVGIASRIRNND